MPIETIAPGNSVNKAGGKTYKYRSTFPLGAPIAGTYRYGEYGVVLAENVIPKDGPFHYLLPHDIRSFMLKGPIMQNCSIKKDAFFVPKQAILPLNWEKLETIPTKGEDVPEDADTVIWGFEDILRDAFNTWRNYITNMEIDTPFNKQEYVIQILKMAIGLEIFYSNGCLMSALGHPLEPYFTNLGAATKTDKHNFGAWFDNVISMIKYAWRNGELTIKDGTNIIYVSDEEGPNQVSWRTMLQLLRDEITITILDEDTNFEPDLTDIQPWVNDKNMNFGIAGSPNEKPFNYERLIAYQIVCAHYYSNDKVDYIYTADLWRQLMWEYINNAGYSLEIFNINGQNYRYDTLSGETFKAMLTDDSFEAMNQNQWGYLQNIFCYRRSLRFMDYFTGARTEPLAVMDYNVAVNNNMVSVVDITRRTLAQKLGNALNKVGGKIESQVKELFGIEMAPDYHNPFWLWHTNDGIQTPETENTGEAQFNLPANASKLPITAQFRSNAGTKEFTFTTDRSGIVIVLQYFEIPRLYTTATERFFFHSNRFEKYNPYMQFTGDQPIYRDELIPTADHNEYFGYTGANMEYKQKFGRAWGGWVHDLPGWGFLADRNRTRFEIGQLGPSYIRAISTEIDFLFQSLIGYSLDTYYHFICKTSVICDATRPMAYSPGILQ